MRLTLDSNILVRAAVASHGPAARLLDIAIGARSLVLSQFIIDEVGRVLRYPRIRLRYGTTKADVEDFIIRISDAANIVVPVVTRPIIPHDPDDDPILYTAAAGKADILCTLNTRHFTGPEAQAFCAQHGIRVMTDLEALRELGS